MLKMREKSVKPEYLLEAFDCPHCGAYASQQWLESARIRSKNENVKNIALSICQLCQETSVWIEDTDSLQPDERFLAGSQPDSQMKVPMRPTKAKLVYPLTSLVPMPTEDMPEEILGDYLEARAVVDDSPRAAAALLRLCVQKLMPLLGEKGKNINDDIASLVKKGLPVEIQQALDSLRVIGNESVHPGEINLNDDRETALLLFDLINLTVERMITQPTKIKALYDKLPESKLKGISTRDKK
jgi:hypothetical protein